MDQFKLPLTSVTPLDIPRIVHLWLYRLLVPLQCARLFSTEQGFFNNSVAHAMGFKVSPGCPSDLEAIGVQHTIINMHVQTEELFKNAKAPDCLHQNLERLAALAGLTEADRKILEFTILLHTDRYLEDTTNLLGFVSSSKVFYVLSILLALPEQQIQASLSMDGILAKSGLLKIDEYMNPPLRAKLILLSESFACHMASEPLEPIFLLQGIFLPAPPAKLALSDFPHLAPSLAVLVPYLEQALRVRRTGVNVLLHGAAGTGKTQLARALAQQLHCDLFEVANEDPQNEPANNITRLYSYRAAQILLRQRPAMILFDEIEDVFLYHKNTSQTRKAWVNKALEENPAPAFWVTNSLECLDAALIRRFDVVVELPILSKTQRTQLLLDSSAGLLNDPAAARIAETEALTPAVITRATSVIKTIQNELIAHNSNASAAVELLIASTLKAQGHNPIRKSQLPQHAVVYDPQFTHADLDLTQLAAGLANARSGRLCLYGPSGTGKTAYGRWLAEQLEMPLLVKRGSDLLSKWVGEQEKNLARAFEQAEKEGALLLIDEVDSFLQDRRMAQRNWEITQVNEMLTQMESFSGVLIASTNLLANIDQAALRRFDFKVKFDYLHSKQAQRLFCQFCSTLAFLPPTAQCLARLTQLPQLTPGDFATIRRRHSFSPLTNADELVAALAAECSLKEGAHKAIGFIH